MQDIQTQVIQRLAKNMKFLSSYNKELFANISILQQALQDGSYKPNYALEMVDGYFDVKNLHNSSWLYGVNSKEFAKQKSEDINYEKSSSSLSLNYRNSYTDAMIEDLRKFSAVNSSIVLKAPIEHIFEQKGGKKPLMKQIYKFAFLGVGLGTHLNMIDEKIKAYHYLIIEDNLELFYLSLFTCDYEALSKNAQLHFAVMQNADGFKRIFDNFINAAWIRNDFLKFCLFSDDYAYKIKQMQSLAITKSSTAYPQHLLLRKNINISKALIGGYKFLNIKRIHDNSPLKDKKVLFLAAGPSLGKHIEWIKTHRDEFFVVAVFMISAKLKNEGIKPDVFIHVDENEHPIVSTLSKFSDFSYFDDVMFCFSASVPLHFFEKFVKKENIYLCEDRTRYKKDFGNLEFYSVGEAGFALCLHLGANELYLLGLDLALDQATGQTHASGHNSSNDKKDLSKGDEVQEVGGLRDTLLKVEANRGGVVFTTPLFEASIRMLNELSDRLVDGQKVYNLSDGAYFKHTLSANIDDVKFDNKHINSKKMQEFLDTISSNHFTQEEQVNMTQRKQDLKRRIRAVNKFATTKVKTQKDLYNAFMKLTTILVNMPKNDLIENGEIFGVFMDNFGSLMGEFLNTKDTLSTSQDLDEIRTTIAEQLKKLIDAFYYINFGYINKVPNYEHIKGLEDRFLDFTLGYQNFSQFKELVFGEKLKADHDGKLLEGVELVPIEKKKGIGFLASFANLRDEEYINYLKEILQKIPEANLVAFYFEEYQKAVVEDKFSELKSKVEVKEVNCIGDIINGCKIYMANSNTDTNYISDTTLYYMHQNYSNNVIVLRFETKVYLENIIQSEKYSRSIADKVWSNINMLGLSRQYSMQNISLLQVYYEEAMLYSKQAVEVIDKDISVQEFTIRYNIANMLRFDEYCKFWIKLVSKIKNILK